MKNVILLSFVLIATLTYSQEKKYFDADFKPLKNEKGAAYYDISMGGDSLHSYFITGELFFTGKQTKDEKFDGPCTWYLIDGTVNGQQIYDKGEYVQPVKTEKHKATGWKVECNGCELPRNDKNLIEWDMVIESKGSAETLYEKAKCVMDDFEDLGQVENIVETNDEQKKASRRFSFDLYYGKRGDSYSGDIAWQKRGSIVFDCAIYCKDDRYRIRFHDFKLVPLDGTGAFALENIYDHADDFGMGLFNKNQEQITQQVVYIMEGYFDKDKELMGYIELIPRKMTSFLTTLRKKCSGQDLINDDW